MDILERVPGHHDDPIIRIARIDGGRYVGSLSQRIRFLRAACGDGLRHDRPCRFEDRGRFSAIGPRLQEHLLASDRTTRGAMSPIACPGPWGIRRVAQVYDLGK